MRARRPSDSARSRGRPLALVGAVVAAALVTLAPTFAGASTTLSLTASARNVCGPASLTAPAGEITIAFTNPHDDWQSFGVVGKGIGTPDRVREGATSTLTATYTPGTYTFWCGDEVDDEDVMRGTLTVTAAGSPPPPPPPPPPGSPPPPPAPPSAVSVTATDFAFSPRALELQAGTVTMRFTNAGQDLHNWTLPGLTSVTASAGETKTVTFFAPPGTYEFFCAVGSHADKGMRGTLTVLAAPGSPPPPPTPPPPPPPPVTPPPPPPGSVQGGSLSVTASELRFEPSSLAASAGAVSVTVTNRGQLPHTFTIDGLVNVEIQPGETKTATFQAAAGSYEFYCALSGHRAAGMVGTLVVSAPGSPPPPPAPPPPPQPPPPPPPTVTPPAPPAEQSPGGALRVVTSEFRFEPTSLTATAGTVSLTVTNRGQLPHTFTIDGLVNVEIQPGETKTATFQAAPGTYRFLCAVPGHDQAGMTGTLTVLAPGASPPPAPPTSPQAPPAGTTPVAPVPPHEHAGQPHGATQRARALPRTCRPRPSVTLTGRVLSASVQSLTVRITAASRHRRAYVGRRVSVLVHAKTSFAHSNGLKAGDRVTITVGRCKPKGRTLIALRVRVKPAAVTQPGAAAGTVLTLTADRTGLPKFDRTRLEAPAGRVTIRMTNPSPLPHNIAIEGRGAGRVVSRGGTSSVTADLAPGTYTFLCALPGHAAAGMKGKLIVK